MSRVHFLHIGKSGGTAIKHALGEFPIVKSGELLLHPHVTKLENVPIGEKVFFFLRNPLSRFYSGFYSRQRKGAPRYNFEWTESEARAFNLFRTPEDLLAAVCTSNDEVIKANAIKALSSIKHVKDHYNYWFKSIEYLEERSNDIIHIGFQESLANDFGIICSKLKVACPPELPALDINAHRNPKYVVRNLTRDEREFFRCWYSVDYEIYDYCVNRMKKEVYYGV